MLAYSETKTFIGAVGQDFRERQVEKIGLKLENAQFSRALRALSVHYSDSKYPLQFKNGAINLKNFLNK